MNLPSDIVPATLKKSAKPLGRPMGGPPGDRPRGPPRFEGDRPRFGDRDGYRGGPRGPPGEFGGEKGGAPADYQPAFITGVLVEGPTLDVEVAASEVVHHQALASLKHYDGSSFCWMNFEIPRFSRMLLLKTYSLVT